LRCFALTFVVAPKKIRHLGSLHREIDAIENAANNTGRAQSEIAQIQDFASGLKSDAGRIRGISSSLRLQYGFNATNTTNTTQSITERTKCNSVNALCVDSNCSFAHFAFYHNPQNKIVT
jgi:hypothetical protein